MDRISLSKSMAFVFFFVVGAISFFDASAASAAVSCFDDPRNSGCRCPSGYIRTTSGGGKIKNQDGSITENDLISNCIPDTTATAKVTDCRTALAEITKTKGQFMSYCRQADKESGAGSMSASHAEIVSCSKKLDECSNAQTSELNYSGMTSMFGMAGIENFMPSEGGVCSKYTQDKLDSLLKEAKREKQTVEKDLEKLNKDIEKATEDANKAKADLENENNQLLEDSKKADRDAKDEARNAQAAVDEKLREAEKSIRSIEAEITLMQRKQQVLIEQRKIQIAQKADRVLVFRDECKESVMKQFSGRNSAGSVGSGNNLFAQKQASYKACMNGKMAQIKSEDVQFPAAMQDMDEAISNRMRDLADAKKSLEDFKKMAAEAKAQADQANIDRAEEVNRRQLAIVGRLQAQIEQTQQRTINNANAISRAKMDVIQAGNELGKLQQQTAIGDKTPTQVKTDYLTNYSSSRERYKSLGCGGTDGMPTIEKIDSGAQ